MLVFLLVLAYACSKEENTNPDVEFRVGSPFYKQDDNTYFKLVDDSLFKYTPNGKVFIEHTIDADMNLSSAELNVSGMLSDNMFPDENQRITCLVDYKLLFQVNGKADGVAIYTGDSTSRGLSNKYEDFPYEVNPFSLDLYNSNQSAEFEYNYWYSGTFNAEMVARNYWYIDSDPKEITKTITIEIIDPESVTFID